MLYTFLQIPARIAFYIWCRKIIINNKSFLKSNGPLLIAANHPNSFLDAILLCSIFKQPIHSLARGDAFKNKFINKILRSLKMLPVYRVSEGVENLEENYKTFDDCINIFKQNGIILIFSEGRCINEWNLRPLKKGTARLAMTAWEQGIPLKVLPLGINYHSFTNFGKNIQLNFGDVITEENIGYRKETGFGNNVQSFNKILLQQLQKLVVTVKPVDTKIIKEKFEVQESLIKKIILFLPACLGYILHLPLYAPIKKFTYKKFGKIDHYDSAMVGILFLLYPFYLILFCLVFYFFHVGFYSLLVSLIFPFTAWSFVQLKKQF